MSGGFDDSIEIDLEPLRGTGEHAVRVLDRFASYDVLGRLATTPHFELLVARERALTGSGRLLTLKVMRPRAAGDVELARSFVRDARVALRLQHPNLCAAYETGVAKGIPYVALELVHGLSVRELIDRAGARGEVLVPSVAAAIAALVADALDAGHLARARAADILGGPRSDALADEVRIGLDGVVKLLATPRDADGDVVLLGLLLHEMLTGRSPSARALDAPIRTWPRAIPPALARVLEQALARDPAQRYTRAAAMRDDLRSFAGADPAAHRSWILEAVLAVNDTEERASSSEKRSSFIPLPADAPGRASLPERAPSRVTTVLAIVLLVAITILALALATNALAI